MTPSHSEQLDQLGAAMAAAQADIEGAAKDRDNPFFKTTYATLASVWAACKPALTKNGLSVLQFSEPGSDGTLALTTMLLHASGQYVSGTEVVRLVKDDPQGYGSAMTYARRYGLAAMVGVSPEDDDAEAATDRRPRQRQQAAPPPVAPRPPVQPQQQAMTGAPAPDVTKLAYKDQTPATCTTEARKWFFAQLRDMGLDHESAAALLTIKSFKEDMGDHTYEQVLGFVRVQQAKQQKAAAQ